MKIWKWVLQAVDRQVVMMPAGAKLLDVQIQAKSFHRLPGTEEICLWALCDENAPKEPRNIAIYGTGNPMPNELGEYIATFQMHGGTLVLHAFEVKQ